MPCYHPLQGWMSRRRSPTGKPAVTFSVREAWADRRMSVPCGQCIGCRLARAAHWAVRCMHEASLHDVSSFVTLTYADEYVPRGGSLEKAAFSGFMKRLRARVSYPVRFFACGEYGERYGRPHYHAILFGEGFADKEAWSVRNGYRIFRSRFLESVWPYGHSEIGTVTNESAGYVARYALKKVTGRAAGEYYGEREPEFGLMSRRPGIGRRWFEKWSADVFPADEVIVDGRRVKPPRYYDGLYEGIEVVKAARRRGLRREEVTEERLAVREQCAYARLSLKERGDV